MSLLHPVMLERYLLYFDHVVMIKIPPEQQTVELLYADGTSLEIDKSIWTQLSENNIPPTFFHNEIKSLWLNDLFVLNISAEWKREDKAYHLHINMHHYGTVVEYVGDTALSWQAMFSALHDRRILSIDSQITIKDEVDTEIARGLNTPIVIELISNKVATEVQEQLEDGYELTLPSMDNIFNDALNQ